MHVLQHLDGREILFKLPVSDDQVFGLVRSKVVQIVDQMRSAGLPIVEFAWSRKERDSLIISCSPSAIRLRPTSTTRSGFA